MEFAAFLGMLPTIGPAGLILVILIYVARLWYSSESRHTAELERVNKAHDDELNELRSDVAELRRDIDSTRELVDEERTKRYRAEEELHALRLMHE